MTIWSHWEATKTNQILWNIFFNEVRINIIQQRSNLKKDMKFTVL